MKSSTCFPLVLAILTASCGTARPLLESDSTRVEVKTVVETVHDTAFIELPVIVEKVATLDTASVLENKYAKSTASVSGGVLHHSLETKAVKQPVPVETKVVWRDSLLYRDRVVKEDIYIEKPLSRWQKLKMTAGEVFIATSIAVLLFFLFHLFTNLKLKV
ncbi:MAG: hypothetical protein IJV32_03880 [Bacteroidales bacterium]|nr:hypothetical protein [Bacteroidales bacterium]